MKAFLRLAVALAAFVGQIAAEPQLIEKREPVYDTVPKLPIRGIDLPSGLTPERVKLAFQPSMKEGVDYVLSVLEKGLVLELPEKKSWPLDEGSSNPLYLKTAEIDSKNILKDGAIQIADIYPTPTVEASDKLIYMKTPNFLFINGTNFNLKHTGLFFDPPLMDGDDVTITVLTSNQIRLVRKVDAEWRPGGPGPLKLVAIDTGAGRLALDSEIGGRTIAEVQASLEFHGISVETHEEVQLYQSSPKLTITGSGFNPEGTALRFANALKEGVNYTVTDISSSSIELKLLKGSLWRRSAGNLPGPLVLLAADGGDGFVALGPTAVKSGRKVATVYEDPSVEASTTQLHRSHSPKLTITGTGFSTEFRPIFFFDQEGLEYKKDYVINVVDRTHVTMQLLVDEWPISGELTVSAIDTGAGKVKFPSPITVATIIDDNAPHESGVSIKSTHLQQLYKSEAKKPLKITGTGFKGTPVLVFDPPFDSDSFTLKVEDDTTLSLSLKPGKEWSAYPGALSVKSIDVGDGVVNVGGAAGVQVATILANPVVKEMNDRIYASKSKHFTIKGKGFVSSLDASFVPVVELDNTPMSAYKIDMGWEDNLVTLQLQPGREWAHVVGNQTVELRVIRVDTGAGEVLMPDKGVLVATVHADVDTALCDDTCFFANDKQCDEPSALVEHGGDGAGNGWGGYSDDEAMMYYSYSSINDIYGSGTFGIAPCETGTDCTDCGLKLTPDGLCTNTCRFARDGHCDDPRGFGSCAEGTDCQDCGPVGKSNFTLSTGSDWTTTSLYQDIWDSLSDDSFIMLSDDILQGQEANAVPVFKRTFVDHTTTHHDNEGAGGIFMDVLWAVVILVGGTVSLGFCMLAYRRFKSGGSSYLPPVYPVGEAQDEFELARLNPAGVGITPDTVRIG